MRDRHSHHLPVACAGLIFQRPLLFWALIAANLTIWGGLALLAGRLLS